jgi:hypothetical protein
MSFSRKLILQRAAAAREEAAASALATLGEDDAPPPPKPTRSPAPRTRSRKDPEFKPRPMDRLELFAPLSVVGVPVTLPTQRVVNYPSGTPCVALGAPRSAWKGKEQLLDVRIAGDEGPVDGWIRAAHARLLPSAEAET